MIATGLQLPKTDPAPDAIPRGQLHLAICVRSADMRSSLREPSGASPLLRGAEIQETRAGRESQRVARAALDDIVPELYEQRRR